MEVNDNLIWVTEGEKFLDNKCTVVKIDVQEKKDKDGNVVKKTMPEKTKKALEEARLRRKAEAQRSVAPSPPRGVEKKKKKKKSKNESFKTPREEAPQELSEVDSD